MTADNEGTHPGPPRLVVVGGGITGLAAAWQGIQRGARVCLLEAADHFGGKVTTVRRDGFVIEQGPDSYVTYGPAMARLIDELGLQGEVIAPRTAERASLLSRGRLRPIPEGMGMVLPTRLWPFITTGVLSWPDKLRAGLDVVIPRQLGEEDVSIGVFLRARLGEGVVRRFADPMVGGIYGADIDELSLDAVLPSLRENERAHRSLLLAALADGRAARRRTGSTGRPSPFHTLKQGLGQLVDTLVARLEAAGADLRAGAEVTGLAEHMVQLADGQTLPADAIVLAGGARSSAQLLRESVPQAADALAAVPLGSTSVVSLAWPLQSFDTPPASPGWLAADPGPVSGLTASSVKFAGRAPDGSVLVRAFVPGKRGALVDAPDAELVAAVLEHIRPLLGVHGAPSLVQISRWHRVMPTYTVGHLQRAAAVDSAVQRAHPSWAVAGSALHGVGLPDCVADGRARADAVLTACQTVMSRVGNS